MEAAPAHRRSLIQGVLKSDSKVDGGKPNLRRKDSIVARPTQVSRYSAVIDSFKVKKDDDKDAFEDARVKMKKFLSHSPMGVIYENVMLVISIISSLEFIYQTYLFHDIDSEAERIEYLQLIELGFAGCFAFDWSLNYFLADQKINFFISFFSMVDVLTVISTYCTYGQDHPNMVLDQADGIDYIMYILFGLRTVRILRSLHARKKLMHIPDAVDRYLFEVSLSAIIIILFATAVIQYLESKTQPQYLFHTWIYYIWVTLSTVGYGDITPQSIAGRFGAMTIIAFAITSVPKVTNELIEKMNLQSVYMRAVYTPRTRYGKHVVICGDLSSTSLNDFFEELFHEDHENTDLSAVMLLPHAPSVEIIFLMRDPKYFLSLSYLEGSALIENDLKRSKAESAVAIFIMTNKFSRNPDEEDAKSILLTLSMKRYLALKHRKDTLFCMQLLRPENRRHLTKNDANEAADTDLVVCLNEIKMGAIAKAAIYPGSNTLLMNLVSSFSDNALELHETDEQDMSYTVEGESTKIPGGSKAWISEYEKGCGWEIYTTKLSKVFEGAKFCELSYALYNRFGVVLFAIQIKDLAEESTPKLLLNPSEYIIPRQTDFELEAFVIAQNQASSDLSFASGEDEPGETAIDVMNRNIGNFGNMIKNSVTQDGPIIDKRKQSAKEINKIFPVANISGKSSTSEGESGEKSKKGSRWKQLKRTALLEAKVKSNNYQETLHKFEDEHFKSNYYLRSAPVDIADVTVKTNVFDEIPHINNHLIVVGKGLRNLYDLIRPLRAKYLGPLRYIVILYPSDIPHDVWQRISIFDAIVIVRGSPLEDSNLRRAGIFRAAQVVVLAEGAQTQSTNMDALVDSDAIFSYQHVKRMNPSTQVVVEIVNQHSIGYLDEEMGALGIEDPKFAPQFAAGTLFTTSLLDSIICQAYYNPQIIKVVHKLLSGVDQLERGELAAKAAADVFGDDDDDDGDSVKKKSSYPEALRRFSTSSRLSGLRGSCLYQMNIPENLEKKTYGALYKLLSDQGMIPLGLLRGTLANINIGPKSNKSPYVYTNPDKDAEVFSCDRVFVLSQKPERVASKLDMKDWLFDLQAQKMQKGGEGSGPSAANSAMKTMETVEKSHRKIEDKVHKLSVDVNKKMTNMLGMMEQMISKIPSNSHYILSTDDEHSMAAGGGGRHRFDSELSVHNIYGSMASRSDDNNSPHQQQRSRFNTADTIHSEGSHDETIEKIPSSESPRVVSEYAVSVVPVVPVVPVIEREKDRERGRGTPSPGPPSDRKVSFGNSTAMMSSPRGILKKGVSNPGLVGGATGTTNGTTNGTNGNTNGITGNNTGIGIGGDGTPLVHSGKHRPSFSQPLVTTHHMPTVFSHVSSDSEGTGTGTGTTGTGNSTTGTGNSTSSNSLPTTNQKNVISAQGNITGGEAPVVPVPPVVPIVAVVPVSSHQHPRSNNELLEEEGLVKTRRVSLSSNPPSDTTQNTQGTQGTVISTDYDADPEGEPVPFQIKKKPSTTTHNHNHNNHNNHNNSNNRPQTAPPKSASTTTTNHNASFTNVWNTNNDTGTTPGNNTGNNTGNNGNTGMPGTPTSGKERPATATAATRSIFSGSPTTKTIITGPKVTAITRPLSTERIAKLRAIQGSNSKLRERSESSFFLNQSLASLLNTTSDGEGITGMGGGNGNGTGGGPYPEPEPFESLLDSSDEELLFDHSSPSPDREKQTKPKKGSSNNVKQNNWLE